MEKSHSERFIVSAFAHYVDAILFIVQDLEKKTEYFGVFDEHLMKHYSAQLTDNPLDVFNDAITKRAYNVEIVLNGNKAIIEFNEYDGEPIIVICARSQIDKTTSLCLSVMKHQYDILNAQNQKQCTELATLREELENVKKSVALAVSSSDDCIQNLFIAEMNKQ